MRYEIGYQPSYSLAILQLEPGEEIRAEAGAMVSMSADLVLEAKMNAGEQGSGLLKGAFNALKKSVLGGESFFVTTVRAQDKPGEVTLAPSTPGDVTAIEMNGRGLLVQGGSYLASAGNVKVDTKWGGLKGLIGGEGLFFLHCSGQGTLFLSSFGGIHKKQLAPGERYVVDSGHMVAYEEGVQMTTRMAGNQGGFLKRAINSATTGEGLVMEFTGPGVIMIQTRNPEAFSSWIYQLLPKPANTSSGAGAALGAVGGLLGGDD